METRWVASLPASSVHAATAMILGRPLVDPQLTEALAAPVADLDSELNSFGIPKARFLGHLCALSIDAGSRHTQVETAVAKTVGLGLRGKSISEGIVGPVDALAKAFQRALPNLVDELALRAEPLRLQWEARGPGLLRAVAELTEENLMVSRADIGLVHPVLGGGGEAHMLYNSVRIEAVLANPDDQLPEVIRLGWLLSQLNQDVPVYSENLGLARLPRIAALSMIPAILSASEQVDLLRCGPETVQRALFAWHLETPDTPRFAPMLIQWWDTYCDARPHWSVALAALDRMIVETEGCPTGSDSQG